VHHATHYAYREPVQRAYHLAFLRPWEDTRQSVFGRSLIIEPAPDVEHEVLDPFGNWRHFFALHTPHQALRVSSRFRVNVAGVSAPTAATRALSWHSVREALSYAAGRRYEPASEFSFASPYAPHDETLRDYAMEVFAGEAGLVTACERFNQRIFEDFRYASSATGVDTPTLEAFRRREGVCQDLAHIMIAGLRSIGLSARYVSGYLLTRPPAGQPRRRGVDASHAWVAVYCPGAEGDWLEFDPTNGIPARQEHVRLAYGRDFGDVSPLRGVILGGGEHQLNVAVTIEETTDAEAQLGPDQDSIR
jgi:transglutaminase-like putative cysteine protease